VKLPFHIPLRMGLLDSGGQAVALCLQGESSPGALERVLSVTQASQSFVFTGVHERPVPSLLRGFSAPVKLHFDHSRDELMFLMTHDSDGFNRWNAGQTLAVEVLQELLGDYQAGRTLVLDQRVVTAWDNVLQSCIDKCRRNQPQDKEMVSQLLTLPSEAYLSELASEIDVAGIHAVREFVADTLARTLAGKFAVLHGLHAAENVFRADAAGIARRALRNTCLAYLMRTENAHWLEVCRRQFEDAHNMTDVGAALRLLVNCELPAAAPVRRKALQDFYARWQHEALVVDQWFSVQATSSLPGTLDQVLNLMQHPAFDIRNPNKVRALIGAFCGQNALHFHEISGVGYEFLAERILQLNALNPQIASRLLTPLTRWRKYDDTRQRLMRVQLQRIATEPALSSDVYEVVVKSLK